MRSLKTVWVTLFFFVELLEVEARLASAQTAPSGLEEKINRLQQQMLKMQKELNTLREQQKKTSEEAQKVAKDAKKRTEETAQQIQTAREEITEKTAGLLDRVKLGGYGSLRFEGNSLHDQPETFTFRRFVLTTEAKIAPRLHFYSELEFERFRKLELERSVGPSGSGLLAKQGLKAQMVLRFPWNKPGFSMTSLSGSSSAVGLSWCHWVASIFATTIICGTSRGDRSSIAVCRYSPQLRHGMNLALDLSAKRR